MKSFLHPFVYRTLTLLGAFLFTHPVQAQELVASDGASFDIMTRSLSVSGALVAAGATGDDDNGSSSGSVYIFQNVDSASGTKVQDVKLLASDGAASDSFGSSVSLFGSFGIVGAFRDDSEIGSAYIFPNLDIASGTVSETAKLTSSGGVSGDNFGGSVGVFGTIGIVGAESVDGSQFNTGAAYIFRGLDTATGNVTENAILKASDETQSALFGGSVAISGTKAIVGAENANGGEFQTGAAYVFRGLDVVSGTSTEDVKLVASDGGSGEGFGESVSLSGNLAVVGASSSDGGGYLTGAAYVFSSLDSATGVITEDVKLIASDGVIYDDFGHSVAISGNTVLVGANRSNDDGNNSGSAYLYVNVGSHSGSTTETLKLLSSDAAADDQFGYSVSVDGDRFVVGAYSNDSVATNGGKAYTGTVSSMTTLDEGNATRRVDGISFESRDDWIIGENTDNNQVTLGAGDSAEVLSAGKAVYIGKNAGSDNNTLIIEGDLVANEIFVGAVGNTGNALQIGSGGSVTADRIVFATGSSILGDLSVNSGDSIGGSGMINGDLTLGAGALYELELGSTLTVMGSVDLDTTFGVDDILGINSSLGNGTYTLIDGTSTVFGSLGLENWGEENAYDLGDGKSAYFQEGSLQLVVIPEPASWVLAGLCLGTCFVYTRKRCMRN